MSSGVRVIGFGAGTRRAAMFRIIDRYIIRELILPFLLGLVVFTFLLMIQPLADYSEQLIAKGVSWDIVARVLVTLVPQALAVTIPDRAADRPADRLRPAVGRSRVGGDAGLRHQHLPAAAARDAGRPSSRGPATS